MSEHDVALVSSFPVIQGVSGGDPGMFNGVGGGGGEGLADTNCWPKNYTFTLF